MYCEIMIQHRRAILPDQLRAEIQHSFGNVISLDQAYARSALYQLRPPSASIFAFDLARDCFVILRKVSNIRSTFHLEGSDLTVSVDTMLHAVQEFATELTNVLKRSDCRVRNLTVQLFEDNGRETGMEGRRATLSSIFRQKFAYREIAPAVMAFVAGLLVLWLGLGAGRWQAVFVSLLVVLAFTLGDAFAGYFWGDGRINWRLGRN
jgi:hypothetical protein